VCGGARVLPAGLSATSPAEGGGAAGPASPESAASSACPGASPLISRSGAAGNAAILWVLAAALALRLGHWAAARGAPFIAALAMDSREYDRWARQIAAGDWLGHGVFFQAPLYPYLLALAYKLGGGGALRLDAVYLGQIALGVAGCFALYRAGAAMAGERVGLAAAALAAAYAPFVFYDVQLLKESLAVTVVCFLLWTLGAAWSAPPETLAAGRWLAAGVLLGVLALLRENALLAALCLLPLAWRGRAGSPGGRSQGVPGEAPGGASDAGPQDAPGCRALAATGGHWHWRAAALRCGALIAGMALALAPVGLRNGLVGGDFLPTTFQGGVNFYIGNNPLADGTYRPIVPGKQVPELERREPVRIAEQQLGRRLSPGEVSRFWLDRALAWAAAHPGDYLRLQLRKLRLFWSWYEWPDAVDYYFIRGLSPVLRLLPLPEWGGITLLAALGLWWLRRDGLARRLAPAWLFAAAWTASTVVFFLFARYRLPAVPALLLLAAPPLAALAGAAADWRRAPARAAAAAACLVLALALPRLAGYAPRLDLVHFNLGRLAEERGDLDLARRHYEAVLAVAPHDFLAWLDLGNLAARRRDWPAALACYEHAAAAEPASDDAQSNLGGVYLALGQPAAAAEHLDRALALNPRSVQALQNSALLRLRLGDLAAARDLNRRALAVEPANPAARRLQIRLGSGPAAPAAPGAPATPGAPGAPGNPGAPGAPGNPGTPDAPQYH
jgi:tetratricopeptide (TPR) repeat protein